MKLKQVYQFHRKASIIIAIPVLLWALSGFMHPIMSTIRPQVATQFIGSNAIDGKAIKTSLAQALILNNISSFKNLRFVKIEEYWFYQIQLVESENLIYLSVLNGKKLIDGDQLYAQYLARIFLEGGAKMGKSQPLNTPVSENAEAIIDCCEVTTTAVLNSKSGAKIKSISPLKNFDDEYRSINKLLPVYKIAFDRKDSIKIFVETSQDRFAFAVDHKRALFSKFFTLLHNWEWLNFLGNGRLLIELFFVGLAFLASCFGIYLFFSTQSKRVKENDLVRTRRNHRYSAITIALFTLMFSFSGFYHALGKFEKDTRDQFYSKATFQTNDINLNFDSIQNLIQKPIANLSLVKIKEDIYYQITLKSQKPFGKTKPNDLMKEMNVPRPVIEYVNAKDFSILEAGDKSYAHYLSNTFSGQSEESIVSDTLITKFAGEYGFVNKRLPVWRVSYSTNEHDTYYVETSSGKLAATINDVTLREATSFNFLHKHHFMDFAGKEVRDFSTMFWAMAQIILVVIGLILVYKTNKIRNQNAKK